MSEYDGIGKNPKDTAGLLNAKGVIPWHLLSDEAMSCHGSNRGASTKVSKARVMRG